MNPVPPIIRTFKIELPSCSRAFFVYYWAQVFTRQFDGGSCMPTTLSRESLFAFAKEHRQEFEELLRRFVEIPTVSVDPSHLDDIRKGVELTVETIERFGGKATVYRADKGNP